MSNKSVATNRRKQKYEKNRSEERGKLLRKRAENRVAAGAKSKLQLLFSFACAKTEYVHEQPAATREKGQLSHSQSETHHVATAL
jgi:hypothetical protein